MPAHIAVHQITVRAANSAPAAATTTQTIRVVAGIADRGTTGRGAVLTRLPTSMCVASAATCAFTAVPQIEGKGAMLTQPECTTFSVHEQSVQRKK
jgi:hypothetical protein